MKNRKGSIVTIVVTIIAALIIVSVIAIICGYFYSYITYGTKEGTIIDKKYNQAYTYTTYSSTYVNGTSVSSIPVQHYMGESYIFIIQKDIKGKIKSIDINVTQDEFNKYNIGDYFKR